MADMVAGGNTSSIKKMALLIAMPALHFLCFLCACQMAVVHTSTVDYSHDRYEHR
jgi:hypothetical protein